MNLSSIQYNEHMFICQVIFFISYCINLQQITNYVSISFTNTKLDKFNLFSLFQNYLTSSITWSQYESPLGMDL